jgi:hypothetical protein
VSASWGKAVKAARSVRTNAEETAQAEAAAVLDEMDRSLAAVEGFVKRLKQ